jgi:uncharacterized protein (DUF58 family)
MPEQLVDRHFLERLERLTLHWQKSFRGLVGGHNLSHFAGPGQEFLDHRGFHPGDDLRSINWRAYMRFDKLILKIFQVEPRVPVRLLLDVSASMTVGSRVGQPSKFDYARRLAAALVYVGLVRLDTILLQPFSSRLHDPYFCTGGRHRFQPAEIFLRNLQAEGSTSFMDLSRQYLNRYPQRGLTIVISDFLGEADVVRPLQYMADFGHELMLVQVWGEEDRTPTDQGEVELVSAETGQTVRLSLDQQARDFYTRAFDEHAAAIQRVALRNQGRYAGVPTSMGIEEAMFGPMTMISGAER